MKIFAPEYYKQFTCIAQECKHNCCIGWEIDVDENTLKKYQKSSHNYAKTVLNSIEMLPEPHFCLGVGERCPHLNKDNLCEIIINMGEEYLCHICREHPRFYNYTKDGMEVGLGMACEEAARLILSSDNYMNMVEIDENGDEFWIDSDFDSRILRDEVYKILSDAALDYNEKLELIYNRFNIPADSFGNDKFLEALSQLECLDESHRTLFGEYSWNVSVKKEHEPYLVRALAYFVYRHCTESESEPEFRTDLKVCLFCINLLASLLVSENAQTLEDAVKLARIVSEEIEYSEDNTEVLKYEE